MSCRNDHSAATSDVSDVRSGFIGNLKYSLDQTSMAAPDYNLCGGSDVDFGVVIVQQNGQRRGTWKGIHLFERGRA